MIIFSIINLVFNIVFAVSSYCFYRHALDLGKQTVVFTLNKTKNRNSWLSCPYLYSIQIQFREKHLFSMIKEEDYLQLNTQQSDSTTVYIREFKYHFFHWNFNQYEFSIREVDWKKKDKARCIKTFLYFFLITEFLIIVIGMQL